MRHSFPEALTLVLRHEGGYVNHPDDPGGATNKGVTQGTYNAFRRSRGLPTRSVRELTGDELKTVYRQNYWDKVLGDDLPAGVDYCTFDAAVNSGPKRGARWLQRAVGAEPDGAVGPLTVAAASGADPSVTIERMCDDRLAFLKGLHHWPTFGRGWSRRVREVRSHALGMAAALPETDPDDVTYLPPLVETLPPPPDVPAPEPENVRPSHSITWQETAAILIGAGAVLALVVAMAFL